MSENPDDILNKYRKKINDHVDKDTLGQVSDSSDASFSNEYSKFRDEITSSKRSSYEQWCNFAERVIKFSPSPKILSSLETAFCSSGYGFRELSNFHFISFFNYWIIIFCLSS
ncbi:MAG: hypothetical protein QT09_C0010G0015 [archaeon GW2011_AR18]|nr:MAG: hypothetical protein QT09_C0010G0015 [archaeon GW2011_AR18]